MGLTSKTNWEYIKNRNKRYASAFNKEFSEEAFRQEYECDPIPDSERLNDMHKQIVELKARISRLSHRNIELTSINKNLQERSDYMKERCDKLERDNEKMKKELDKVHSRFEILDL
jgi:prefoldin subunit 5